MNNEDLYQRIVTAKEDEDFKDIFSSLNLYEGYSYIDQIECNEDTKNKLIRYTAYCYTYNSSMLRKHKDDRTSTKISVMQKVGIEPTTEFAIAILKCKDENFNAYVKWWLHELHDLLWAVYISGIDFIEDQLMFVREGLHIEYTGDNAKMAALFIKNVKKDSELKAKAYFNARKAIEQIDADKKEIERKLEFLEGHVKKEIPEFFEGKVNWAELMIQKKKSRINNSHLKAIV